MKKNFVISVLVAPLLLSGCGFRTHEPLPQSSDGSSSVVESAKVASTSSQLTRSSQSKESIDENESVTHLETTTTQKVVIVNQAQFSTSTEQVEKPTQEFKTKEERSAYYRKEMLAARDKQQAYIDSLPENKRTEVQSTYGALNGRSIGLEFEYPDDVDLIREIKRELLEDDSVITTETSLREDEIIMKTYEQENGVSYTQCSPATYRNYYGLSVPDEFLMNSYWKGDKINFYFYEWASGEGNVYQLEGIYIRSDGQEVILFAQKDGMRFVFSTTAEPIDHQVTIELSEDSILSDYMQ